MRQGLIHIYCGEGKGKTTAAVGLGVRAAGSGFKVCLVQFLKSGNSGEISGLKKIEPNFEIINFERPFGFFWTLSQNEKDELKKDIEKEFNYAKEVMQKGRFDMLILDEILGAVENKLIDEAELIEALKNKHGSLEIVITGRNASQALIDIADYVSKIDMVKHPFEKGVKARKGIEF